MDQLCPNILYGYLDLSAVLKFSRTHLNSKRGAVHYDRTLSRLFDSITAPARSTFLSFLELAPTPRAGVPVSEHGVLSLSGAPLEDSAWDGAGM